MPKLPQGDKVGSDMKTMFAIRGVNKVKAYYDTVMRLTGPTAVTFVREPKNTYDPNAIRIDIAEGAETGKTVGYVPRELAMIISPVLDADPSALAKGKIVRCVENWGPDENYKVPQLAVFVTAETSVILPIQDKEAHRNV